MNDRHGRCTKHIASDSRVMLTKRFVKQFPVVDEKFRNLSTEVKQNSNVLDEANSHRMPFSECAFAEVMTGRYNLDQSSFRETIRLNDSDAISYFVAIKQGPYGNMISSRKLSIRKENKRTMRKFLDKLAVNGSILPIKNCSRRAPIVPDRELLSNNAGRKEADRKIKMGANGSTIASGRV